jgi:CO/xanthine dehydrogenase FAD-binding subunit
LSPEAIAQASRQVAQDLGDDIIGDLYASADYRKNVASVWVKRAITAAVERTN